MNARFVITAARAMLLAGSIGAVSACGGDEGTEPAAPAPVLRVVNGTPGAVRVVVDGITRITTLAAGTVSAAITVRTGERVVVLEALSGSSVTGSATTQTITALGDRAFITAIAVQGALIASVVADTGAVPAEGMSKLRVIHLAASAPAIDVWRTQPDAPTPLRLMFPFAYGATSSFVQGTPGIWEVIVTPAKAPVDGEPSPRPSSLVTLALGISSNIAATVVVLDAAGGGVRLAILN